MSKTNFSKVEKSLEEGMIRITSQNLLSEADALIQKKSEQKLPSKEIRSTVLQKIDRDLNKLVKQDENLYKKIVLKDFDLKKMIANPSLLTPQEWKTVKEIKGRIEKYKKELAAQIPFQSDDDLIEKERSHHLTKRFNVNDKWIPLK